jgi:hypothetical protein
MNTKEAYKLAYGQWRLLSKQRESMPDQARVNLYSQHYQQMDVYGGKTADRAIKSFEQRGAVVSSTKYEIKRLNILMKGVMLVKA